MLDPIRLTIDAKRTISYSQFANNVSPDSAPTFPLLLWKTKAVMDVAHINIGQKDISTIVEVWEHNVNRIYRVFCKFYYLFTFEIIFLFLFKF